MYTGASISFFSSYGRFPHFLSLAWLRPTEGKVPCARKLKKGKHLRPWEIGDRCWRNRHFVSFFWPVFYKIASAKRKQNTQAIIPFAWSSTISLTSA